MTPAKPKTKSKKASKAKTKLQFKNVKKSFGDNHVLRGVDLHVPQGKSLVILGGSGSGKSVALKCALGLITPDSGEITIDGKDVTNLNDRERDDLMQRFGMLFQGGALFDSLPIWENVAFGLIQCQNMNRKDAKDIAIEKLRSVGLGERVAPLFPAELSGGMQKRVALARAIATEPEIIFFDEPTTGLDPIMADVINELIIKCREELGATTLSITHDMHSARRIADNVAMLFEGKIIWHGSVKEMDKTKDEYVQQFIHGRAEGPIQMTA